MDVLHPIARPTYGKDAGRAHFCINEFKKVLEYTRGIFSLKRLIVKSTNHKALL